MNSTWITSDDLGVIAFQTKGAAKAVHPSSRPVRCVFAMGFLGWLAMDQYSTDSKGTVLTPDRREVPVVAGWSREHGRVVGFRGGRARHQFEELFRNIMSRVVEAGLELHAYQQSQHDPQ